jgi:hypothetical protein
MALSRAIAVVGPATLLIGLPGCMEDIALVGRPSIETVGSEVSGEIERIDLAARRIYLRAKQGEHQVVALGENAQALYRGREYSLAQLKPGDIVAINITRDSPGDAYAYLIRVQSPAEETTADARDPDERTQTLAGKVMSLNRPDNTFELDDRAGQPVTVTVSDNVRQSDRDRFRSLRAGDDVRIEGKFTGRDRFELLRFSDSE